MRSALSLAIAVLLAGCTAGTPATPSKDCASPVDLVIEAKLDGTAVSETRLVRGGPGPSIIDLPRSGCWRLTLTWPEHTDTMGLVYR